ncbi:predicted protein [Botrytis cinerea T4]|uniref:Uncharacterized protein n=1 Tax=Botryotinia fuckeliana (strain T4) TaxID=999810 RepID=G2Y7G6_BOTF4|nr:predicted protein [Botrytis cinerea T4]
MSDESECEAELKTFMSGKGMDIVQSQMQVVDLTMMENYPM